MKTGIVLEGGALRTIFSSGVCDALLEADLLPDYVIGVSAGIEAAEAQIDRVGAGTYRRPHRLRASRRREYLHFPTFLFYKSVAIRHRAGSAALGRNRS